MMNIDAGEEKSIRKMVNVSGEDSITVGEGAKLNVAEVIDSRDEITSNTTISSGPESAVNLFSIILNGDTVHRKRIVNLDKNAEYNEIQIVIGKGKQLFDISTVVNHNGEGSRANIRAKGIMKDQSSVKIPSLLRISPLGKKSNTHSSQHFLLLSKKARADPSPSLEIETDDVIAGHSASVSQIDFDKIFYLVSKGILEDEAKDMLVRAFLEPEISQVSAHIREVTKLLESV